MMKNELAGVTYVTVLWAFGACHSSCMFSACQHAGCTPPDAVLSQKQQQLIETTQKQSWSGTNTTVLEG